MILLAVGLSVVALAMGALALRSARELRRLRGRLERAALELQNLQLAFGRFAPEDVIEKLLAGGSIDIGDRKEVTVLFADLVDFTRICEQVAPVPLVRILNGYFERMSQAITERQGYVSTFIGDGILALFGAMAPNPWQANEAVHAALAMQSSLRDYNQELLSEGLPELGMGIGLHRGIGVAGLVGSHHLKQFTFVGGTVNIAARIQGLTRTLGADIIVTETLRQALDPRFELRPLPDTLVKGVEKPLRIHAVTGHGSGSHPGPPSQLGQGRRP